MRWFLNTDHGAFSVDNAAVRGMDFGALSHDIWMVQWIDGKGELERQVDADTNDNGLREQFLDLAPYAPYFQQFLTKLPGLTLPQAKKTQTDLVEELFRSKRQLPFPAYGYQWNTSDEEMSAMTQQLAVATTGSSGTNQSALSTLVADINAKLVDAYVSSVNVELSKVNANSEALSRYTSPGYGLYPNPFPYYELDRVLQAASADNYTILINSVPLTFLGATYAAPIVDPTIASLANIAWHPLNATAPVALSFQQFVDLMTAIVNRRTTLRTTGNTKKAQINALTTIPAVIAYNVTSGW